MTTAAAEHLQSLPSPVGLYLKAAGSARRKPKGRPQIPALAARVAGLRVDAANLAAYREICGFAESESLPLVYPQIMATPLAMHLMAGPSFPLPMLGLVHLRNHIEQSRPLRADEAFDVDVSMGESRDVKSGLEFDILMQFSVDGSPAWRATMTVLYRLPSPRSGGKPAVVLPPVELAQYHSFNAPADIGRRYAKISGDYNPIHLYATTAKLFGFPRAIAHGLWSLARCCALLQPELKLGQEPRSLSVQFKQPLLLPGKVALKLLRRDDALEYSLLSRTSDKVHLSGTLR